MTKIKVKVTNNIYHSTCGEERCCDFYDLSTVIESEDSEVEFYGNDGQQMEFLLSYLSERFGFELEFEDNFESEGEYGS